MLENYQDDQLLLQKVLNFKYQFKEYLNTCSKNKDHG